MAVMTPVKVFDLAKVRELRLWHWEEATAQRFTANRLRRSKRPTPQLNKFIERHDYLANVHLGFVQTLNAFFEAGDTAEKDASK